MRLRNVVTIVAIALAGVFIVGCTDKNAPTAKDPVVAYRNGTLIDCRDRYPVYIPRPLDVGTLLDEEDKNLVTTHLPGFLDRFVEGKVTSFSTAILFLHYAPSQDNENAEQLFSYVSLVREKDGGYCAWRSAHGVHPFNDVLLKKYMH